MEDFVASNARSLPSKVPSNRGKQQRYQKSVNRVDGERLCVFWTIHCILLLLLILMFCRFALRRKHCQRDNSSAPMSRCNFCYNGLLGY